MPARYPIRRVQQECQSILLMWSMNPNFKTPLITRSSLMSLQKELEKRTQKIAHLENTLIEERLALNTLANEIADHCTRLRSCTRAYFGPDAAQVKAVGLTRTSERKKPSPKGAKSPRKTGLRKSV